MKHTLFTVSAAALVAFTVLTSRSHGSPPQYTVTDLGTLGGDSYAFSINASGQVAGYSFLTGNSVDHAVRWADTTPTDLGTLGGGYSNGYGINASGQVAGASYIT